MTPIEIIACVLIFTGLFFFYGAIAGVLRFPDFYTRMHAAGKGDTLSSVLIMAGLGLYHLENPDLAHVLVALKIFGIAAFIMITSPTSTHALMQAGYEAGMKVWHRKDGKKLKEEKEAL